MEDRGQAAGSTLEIREVSKRYGDYQAVDRVSLTVPPGVVYGLLGPNGAGKTTTIRMIMDIIAPDSGEVLIFGHRRRSEDLQRIGYLPEERGLYNKMTVHEHLAFLGELHGLPRRRALSEAESWLERLDLAGRLKSKVEELSKGMQQKIQIAGTLLHDPELIILDEPFSGLDPINQGVFKELLADYKRRGKTILFSTHIMEHAEKLCDHICLISKGRVVRDGELAAIKRREGGQCFRLKAAADREAVAGQLAGRAEVVGDDGDFKLFASDGVEGPELLRQLAASFAVSEFRSEEPDLEEIFIKVVNESEGVSDAA